MKLDFTLALQLEFALKHYTVLPSSFCYSEINSLRDSSDINRVIEKKSERSQQYGKGLGRVEAEIGLSVSTQLPGIHIHT